MALKSNLVIVESPAKARTINKILGKDFVVKASIGHVKDLPKNELGVDIENGYIPQYINIPGKGKTLKELREAATRASTIYLAPDPDREGEAIAWHISEVISDHTKKSKKTQAPLIHRISFNEITERAVREAIKSPSEINRQKVEAQQARRVLDRLVGYKLSPLLWRKVKGGLSAGRVQSVAVRLIVDREREIEVFKKEEYWSITGLFEGSTKPQFKARLLKYKSSNIIERSAKGNKFLIKSDKEAEKIKDDIKNETFSIKDVDKKLKKRMPYPPFITSTLQQTASQRLRFTAKKTMLIAQQLYEGIEIGEGGSVGLITYMRTDSTRIASEAENWAREYISNRFGNDYIPSKPNRFKAKSGAQEAHEAIRPTYKHYEPVAVKKYLTRDQFSLYELIWDRFIACQMTPASVEQTTLDISDPKEKAQFRATGTVIKFKGFLSLYSEGSEEGIEKNQKSTILDPESDVVLPDLRKGESVNLLEISTQQHFTQPPPRYTEASLVKTLEEKGVGRPSTYAAILSTIVDRKYVEKTERRFRPTELGVIVNDLLVERFPELIDIKFTAKMENDLDRVEEGKKPWDKVIDGFYPQFNKELEEVAKVPGKIKPKDIPTETICEECDKPMVQRWGKHGRFLACSGFPSCKNTKAIEKEEGDKKTDKPIEKTDEICEKCNSPMVIKNGRFGRFLACSNYPSCKNTRPLSTGLECPEDDGFIVEKKSKKGKLFYSCSNYPECRFASWYRPIAEQCPDCGAELLFEKTNKEGKTIIFCLKKECKYKREESKT